MMPVLAGIQIPAGIGGEVVEIVDGMKARGLQQRLSGNAGFAGGVAKGETKLVVAVEGVTEIAGHGAVAKRIVGALAVGFEIGSCAGVVESADEAAELSATAAGGEAAAFGEGIESRDASFAAVGEELDDGGDGVGAVESAFRGANDFDFIDVVERDVGEVNEAPRQIYRRAVDQHFRLVGIAAVHEGGSRAAFRASLADRHTWS